MNSNKPITNLLQLWEHYRERAATRAVELMQNSSVFYAHKRWTVSAVDWEAGDASWYVQIAGFYRDGRMQVRDTIRISDDEALALWLECSIDDIWVHNPSVRRAVGRV